METVLGRIHILKKPDVTDLSGEKVMIDFESGNYFMLKGAANDIWDLLKEDITMEEIVAELMATYTIEETECRAQTRKFLDQLQKIGFISIG